MNILTLNLGHKPNQHIFSGDTIKVKVYEKIPTTDNFIQIYATKYGIILDNGIFILSPHYDNELLLDIKNNTKKTITLMDGEIIANYLEIFNPKKTQIKKTNKE